MLDYIIGSQLIGSAKPERDWHSGKPPCPELDDMHPLPKWFGMRLEVLQMGSTNVKTTIEFLIR